MEENERRKSWLVCCLNKSHGDFCLSGSSRRLEVEKLNVRENFLVHSCQKLKWIAMETALLFILFFCSGHANFLSLSPCSFSILGSLMCHSLGLEQSLHPVFLHFASSRNSFSSAWMFLSLGTLP